jgi:hypothetical protein
MPNQAAALLGLFKNPLWPFVVGLILLAKQSPATLHGAVDGLAGIGTFLFAPENAVGTALVTIAAVWQASRTKPGGQAFIEGVGEALAKIQQLEATQKAPPAPKPTAGQP